MTMTDFISTVHRPRSAELWRRAVELMPGGVSSPVRAFGGVSGTPVFIERACGPYVIDVDGHTYIDLVGSWGPAIVGHAHPKVIDAVQRAAASGLSFGACSHLESELAERIVRAFPSGSIECVRFVSSGTEACMSAARLARGATGRRMIVKFEGHYHGHADGFLVAAGSGAATFGAPTSPGVPDEVAQLTLVGRFNDLESVEQLIRRHGGDIAAIFVEPIAGNMGFVRPEPGFLEGLRRLCDACGALLVFDEVMTGFRVAYGGYQNHCGITPDLTTLGKVIGGGMPAAAYAGPRRLMDLLCPNGSIYQAGTLSGNPLAMAAGIATLNLCAESNFYDRLERMSARLADGLRDAAGAAVHVDAMGGMLGMSFTDGPVRRYDDIGRGDHQRFARFFHAMLDRGIWLPPSHFEAMFISAAHEVEHVDLIIAAARDAFREVL